MEFVLLYPFLLYLDETVPIPPPAVLAPEDVEMISEEEISEVDEVESFAVSNMQVIDEVLPNETRTPSVHEDSLDMDQFEPILSGSSDIESEEDIDFQVNEKCNAYIFSEMSLTSLIS